MVYFTVKGGSFVGGDITSLNASDGLNYAESFCSEYSQCDAVSKGDNENVYWLKHIQYPNPGEYRSDFNAYVNMNKVGNLNKRQRTKLNQLTARN